MRTAHKIVSGALIFSGIFAAAAPGSALAADALTEDRLARLERMVDNRGGSDMMLQMQQLQQEMQELRGLVETQQFELQKLQRQQRDQFLDIDSRLSAGAGAAASDPAVAGASPAPTAEQGAIDAGAIPMAPPPGVAEQAPITAPTPSSPGAVGIPSLPSPETMTGNERDAYQAAFELLKQRKYPEAVDALNELLRNYPQGQYTDNARYWLGETYYVQRNYPAALAEYDRVVQLHPNSTKVPGALLKIGYIQYEQESWDQARAALKQVVTAYPGSTEARLAQSRLEKMGRAGH